MIQNLTEVQKTADLALRNASLSLALSFQLKLMLCLYLPLVWTVTREPAGGGLNRVRQTPGWECCHQSGGGINALCDVTNELSSGLGILPQAFSDKHCCQKTFKVH